MSIKIIKIKQRMKMIHIMLFMISKVLCGTHIETVYKIGQFSIKRFFFYIIYILCVPEIGS